MHQALLIFSKTILNTKSNDVFIIFNGGVITEK